MFGADYLANCLSVSFLCLFNQSLKRRFHSPVASAFFVTKLPLHREPHLEKLVADLRPRRRSQTLCLTNNQPVCALRSVMACLSTLLVIPSC